MTTTRALSSSIPLRLAGALGALALTACPGPTPHETTAGAGGSGGTTTSHAGGSGGTTTTSAGGAGGTTIAQGGAGGSGGTTTSAGGAGGSGGTTTSAGGAGGAGTGGAGGAGGACPQNLTRCGQDCVDLNADGANCGACGRPCSLAGAASSMCNGGVCAPTCNPGSYDVHAPKAPLPDDGCDAPGWRTFVTHAATKADFQGAAGADAFCQAAADAAKLGGTWRAWVSDANSSPSTRFLQAVGPYLLLDKTTVVATDWKDLTDGTLAHAIDLDEAGTSYAGVAVEVWTGTGADGTSAPNDTFCQNWTTQVLNAIDSGTVGVTTEIANPKWTSDYPQTCDRDQRFYCFEQY
jgi:hypothetical protein